MALAQVIAIHPEEFAVEVQFPNTSHMSSVRVRVAAGQASATTGSFALPKRGDWGVVAFTQDDIGSARWLSTLTDAITHAAPLENLQADPDLQADFSRSGRDTYHHGNGDIEVQFPDGSLFRLTHSDEGDAAKRTERKVSVSSGPERAPERVPSDAKEGERPIVYFEQKERTKMTLNRDGDLEGDLTIKQGPMPWLRWYFLLHHTGKISLKNRAMSSLELGKEGDIELKTKTGASLKLTKDGEIELKTLAGASLKLTKEGDIELKTLVGASLKLGKEGGITLGNKTGAAINLDVIGNVELKESLAGFVRLGSNPIQRPVARIGDAATPLITPIPPFPLPKVTSS